MHQKNGIADSRNRGTQRLSLELDRSRYALLQVGTDITIESGRFDPQTLLDLTLERLAFLADREPALNRASRLTSKVQWFELNEDGDSDRCLVKTSYLYCISV